MPTFEDVELELENKETQITIKTNIDFEVYCDTCGAGICSNAKTVRSRNRGTLQVRVSVCDNCIQNKEDELNNIILELTGKIAQLEEEKQKLEKISELKNNL
ncbi:MAG: hypothetical protein PHF86_01090 [Candidatus Nanoarchaeia archaeon]|nr:hypothetical protein [Candidatus Nanoarchaeia archaeon]